jgi:hypothetical protein
MPDTDYQSMLKDLKALPKTWNPIKLVQRKMIKSVIVNRMKEANQ